MKKVLIALAAAATIAAGTLSAPTSADARCYGCAVGAGVIGGLAAGAIIGGAVANSYPRYAPAPGYVVYEGYGQPYPVACPGGYWARRPIAFDAYGNPIRWSRARFVCP
ncbi:MAG TPA: hypothetical protein VHD59_14970 [Pseudolabrys sp.]|jgi:hypothetical protein|nr:hypothetical protein [Pseudolabrys sp.]